MKNNTHKQIVHNYIVDGFTMHASCSNLLANKSDAVLVQDSLVSVHVGRTARAAARLVQLGEHCGTMESIAPRTASDCTTFITPHTLSAAHTGKQRN